MDWNDTQKILESIKPPIFSSYTVSIDEFDAIADGKTINTQAIQNAIMHVHEMGGGTVTIPSGQYLTGSIQILSNVRINLQEKNSELCFTTDIDETNYPLAYGHWECTPLWNYRALIYAIDAENIAVTGNGILNGQASENVWWDWTHQIEHAWSQSKPNLQIPASIRLRSMNDTGVDFDERVFGDGNFLRPNFIQLIRCQNILLQGVTILNSPMWQVNPVLCTNVTIRGMTLQSHGHNNDGVDPESCRYVLIEKNYFDSGDDCIAIKSGRDRDGREMGAPCQDIIIRDNIFSDGHGGIAIGSEMSGGVKNVFAENNIFDSPNLTYALRIKTNALRGGFIENVYFRNSSMKNVGHATVHITMNYAEGRRGDFVPKFKNITIENINSNNGLYGIYIEAFDDSPIEGLVLKNIKINNVANPIYTRNCDKNAFVENVVINDISYPQIVHQIILGIPTASNRVYSEIHTIGIDENELKIFWFFHHDGDDKKYKIGVGNSCQIPEYVTSGYVWFETHFNDQVAKSYCYRVVDSELALYAKNDDSCYGVARLYSKNVLRDKIDKKQLLSPIFRIELARIIMSMQSDDIGLGNNMEIFDIERKDIPRISCLVRKGIFSINNGSFLPNNTIFREEFATICMMATGQSLHNASYVLTSVFRDGDNIEDVYMTNAERACNMKILSTDENNNFDPKGVVCWGEALSAMSKVSDFLY